MTDWVTELCTYVGVHSNYRGFDGQTIEVTRETQGAVLAALGLEARTDGDARDILARLRAEDEARPLPPEVIVEVGKPSTLSLSAPVEWVLEAEGTGETLGSGKASEALALPALSLGIHRLRLSCTAREFTTWVLARPHLAIQLEDLVAEGRIWGVMAALYGLTDGASVPLGTYDLLGDYAAAVAEYGADFLGINPVHAMGQTRPGDVISPYSPNHRAFLNTWHCTAGAPGDGADLIDYPSALSANAHAMDQQFETFQTQADSRAFEDFQAQAGPQLHDFALFEALAGTLGPDWREWPLPYRNRDAETLASFATRNARQIRQSKWAQWQAEMQLSKAQTTARAGGMRLGLYLDLAVGPRLGGAETWAEDSALVTGATLGAPPDPLGPQGQSWGLAPMSPLKCRAEGYASFGRLLRANMRRAGMIRIDHVLGLMRNFWIPQVGGEGTFVSYPFDALLAVVAIESVRNQTIVVGEDLGLVPDGLRDALATSGIYGLDILQYMRSTTGGFVPSSDMRELAVCAFATHDTPTAAGFFAAEDTRIRNDLGVIDAETLEHTREDRRRALATLQTTHPVPEIHRRLAQSSASMVAVQLDDVAGRLPQQNLPATVDEYPNWRLKAPFTLNDIASSPAFADVARDMAAAGRTNRHGLEKDNDLSDCSDHAH